MYSAVKRDGKPLYEYARKGEVLERDPRTIHVSKMDVEHVEGATVTFLIECSGGTYVRSLAHDMGQLIGCGAYLSGLVRLKVGKFDLSMSKLLDQVSPSDLMPLREALEPMLVVELNDADVAHVREGRQIPTSVEGTKLIAVAEAGGEVFGITRLLESSMLQPECVIPKEASFGSS
jgi:tRNA pseudouridine55 synthase